LPISDDLAYGVLLWLRNSLREQEEDTMAKDEEIRPLARAIWEKEGRPEGGAEKHWQRARELLETQERQTSDAHVLPISDWISFLTAEKNPNIAIIISFTALWIAVFSIVKSLTSSTLASTVAAVVTFVILLTMYFRTIGPYGSRAKRASELLKDIMSGKERDPSTIEERWNQVAKDKRANKKG
jgi:hypothetical protein